MSPPGMDADVPCRILVAVPRFWLVNIFSTSTPSLVHAFHVAMLRVARKICQFARSRRRVQKFRQAVSSDDLPRLFGYHYRNPLGKFHPGLMFLTIPERSALPSVPGELLSDAAQRGSLVGEFLT